MVWKKELCCPDIVDFLPIFSILYKIQICGRQTPLLLLNSFLLIPCKKDYIFDKFNENDFVTNEEAWVESDLK